MNYPVSIVIKKAEEELKRSVVDIKNKYNIPPDIMVLVYKSVYNAILEDESMALNDAYIDALNELEKTKDKEDESCQSG